MPFRDTLSCGCCACCGCSCPVECEFCGKEVHPMQMSHAEVEPNVFERACDHCVEVLEGRA